MDDDASREDAEQAPDEPGDGPTEGGPAEAGDAAGLTGANAPEHAPGDLWADDLLDESEPEEGPSAAARELRAALERSLAQHDKPTFVRTAVEAVTKRQLTIPELYRDVLTPLLADLGAGWQRGRVAVWEEHLASAMVRSVVEILYPGVLKAKLSVPPTGRSALFASPPEEYHDLGLRMVADRFDMAGWTTYFLGADSPIDETIDAARKLGVDAVVISSATHFHRLALRHYVDRLERELDHVHVWVGGPAFAADTQGWASYEVRDLDALLAEFAPAAAQPEPPREEEPEPPREEEPEPVAEEAPAFAEEPAGEAAQGEATGEAPPDAAESPAAPTQPPAVGADGPAAEEEG